MNRTLITCVLAGILLTMAGCYTPPADDDLIGMSEAEVRGLLGDPDSGKIGHYGEFEGHKTGNDVRTLTFVNRSVVQRVTFERQGMNWVAVRAETEQPTQ